MYNNKIFALIIVISCLIVAVSSKCGSPPKIIFYKDQNDVLEVKQNELCNWDWSDPYSPEDAKNILAVGTSIKLKAKLNEGDGRNITNGDPSPEGGFWKLKYQISYTSISGEHCDDEITRNVRILEKAENPCEREAVPCAKNGLPDSAVCAFDIRYRNCKHCSCKLGCEAGPNGAEDSCVDKNMCPTLGRFCPVNSTCTDLTCPQLFTCRCNKGFVAKQLPEFNCKSENECEMVKEVICLNKNECTDKFICPPHSRCVNTWPKVNGCENDPNYPDKYPAADEYRCGYRCECIEGFTRVRVGNNQFKCQKLCSKACPPDAICEIDENDKESCVCKDPFYRYNPDTNKCEPIDHCHDNTHDCDTRKPGSLCKYTGPGRYDCVCPPETYEFQGKCVEKGKCESGKHKCMRNSKDGPVKSNYNEDVDVANSYCVGESGGSYRCKCDDNHKDVVDKEGNQVCLFIPKELRWHLEPKDSPDISLPHFARKFVDPSYKLHSDVVRITCDTLTPSEFYRNPLDICGVYKVNYTLDETAVRKLEGLMEQYPSLKDDPEIKKQLEEEFIRKTRKVTIYSIDRCDDNLPDSINGVAIDVRAAKYRCARYADCKNRKSNNWEFERREDSCNYTCTCFDGYFRGKRYTPLPVDPYLDRECKYPKDPRIYFEKGVNHTLPNTDDNKRLFKMDFSKPVNVLRMGKECIVCETKISGYDLDIKKFTDHKAYYPYPIFEKQNREWKIVDETFHTVPPEITNVEEIPFKDIDKTILQTIIPSDISEQLGDCEPNEPCLKVYVVTYRAIEGNNMDEKKRIVYTPIINVQLYIGKVRSIVYWLEIIYNIMIIFFLIAAIYLLFLSFGRLYACFQYFILGNTDKNNARIAWDTVYMLRHPFNPTARSQLVYQSLYLD